ncbi:MAG TPA: CDP-alcohol phosphatidyltransferase family protein [Thermoanaerobaculia bacterium]|nr:CDP-alcohol phosphatidyltransferase family protein [Thermoanaerobaculia bacterium]
MLTIPNLLTLLRLLLVPVFLLASMQGMYRLAFVVFVSAAITDILDGMIARRLNQRSRLGAFLDPAADKLLMVSGYLFYTFAHLPEVQLPGWLTFTVLIRDVLIVAFAYLLYTRVQVQRFPPTLAGKASTVLQAVNLALVIAVNAFAPQWLMHAHLMFRVTLVVTLISAVDYMRRADRLLDDGVSAHA